MKRLILILILTFSFQTLTKADDIRDFEIEGISIGDSLLDHFVRNKINSGLIIKYDDDKFYDLQLDMNNSEDWPVFAFSVKKKDKRFIIHAFNGGKFFDKINKCEKKKEIIVKDLTENFLNQVEIEKYTYTYKNLADGKSISNIVDFNFKDGKVRVYCTDWSKKTEIEFEYSDNLRLEIATNNYLNWLDNEAYE